MRQTTGMYLMISTDKKGENGSNLLAAIVLVKGLHAQMMLWSGQAGQIVHVSHGLKVAAANKQVHLASMLLFDVRQSFVDLVQFTVAASFDCDQHFRRKKKYGAENKTDAQIRKEKICTENVRSGKQTKNQGKRNEAGED